MNPTLTSALWITLIGMGLVFIALMVLWGLMALAVRLTARQAQAEAAAQNEAEAEAAPLSAAPEAADSNLRRKAAAAAVAAALALKARGNGHILPGAAEPFSAWQPVQRANQLNQHSRMYSRRPRGDEK